MRQPADSRPALSGLGGAAPAPRTPGRMGVYLAVTFGFSWACQLAACGFAWAGQTLGFTAMSALCMWGPGLGVLAACGGLRGAKTGIRGWRPRFAGRWGGWLAAWLAPAALTVLGGAVYYVAVPAAFDPTATSYLAASLGENADAVLGLLSSGWPLVAIQLTQALLLCVVNVPVALGEEIGWRGWLYPRLKARLGEAGGRIAGGLVWGVWHWPLIAFAGYEYGYTVFDAPTLAAAGMLLFCVITVALGVCLDAVYLRTGSIWAPALAHGAFNAVASLPLLACRMDYPVQLLLGPLPIGLIGGAPLLILALVLLLRSWRRDTARLG